MPSERRSVYTVLVCLVCGAFWGGASHAADEAGPLGPAAALPRLSGEPFNLLAPHPERATVLVFILADCPIANAYAPEIERIRRDYAERDIRVVLIYEDSRKSGDELIRHAREYGHGAIALWDARHQLAVAVGVRIVPQAVILSPRGESLYRGRIDDLYADYGRRRARPTQHDLRQALDTLLEGRPIPEPTGAAIGCILPPAETIQEPVE